MNLVVNPGHLVLLRNAAFCCLKMLRQELPVLLASLRDMVAMQNPEGQLGWILSPLPWNHFVGPLVFLVEDLVVQARVACPHDVVKDTTGHHNKCRSFWHDLHGLQENSPPAKQNIPKTNCYK